MTVQETGILLITAGVIGIIASVGGLIIYLRMRR